MSKDNEPRTSETIFGGRTPFGVCVTHEDYIFFVLKDTPSDNGKYDGSLLLGIYNNFDKSIPQAKWGYMKSGYGWDIPIIAPTITKECILANPDSSLWHMGVGDNKQWERSILGENMEGVPYALAKIGGRYVATGKDRSIFIYNSPQKWQQAEPSGESIEHMWNISKHNHDRPRWKSFYALDGFSLDDMYLGGGYGDLWHYKHKTGEWKALGFESDQTFLIQAICCADDGKVYVGGRDGMLAIGRDEEWQFVRLKHGRHIEKIKSVDGKIYIGTEAHTYVYQGANDCEIYEGDATSIWSDTFGRDRESIEEAVKSIDSKPNEDGGIFAMANIDDEIIVTGKDRRIFIRKCPSRWNETQAPVSCSKEQTEGDDNAFCALDGFSKEDIYLGGGDSDLWHYKLATDEWELLNFKTDKAFLIQAICCADDGKVYVGGRDGMLAIGRDNEWEFVHLDSDCHIEKIIDFNGKVFIGTKEHTYILNDKHQANIYDFDGELNFTGGHLMHAAYGVMVVVNTSGKAALYREGKWEALHGIEA